jgi:hypothetical protein
MSPPSYQKQIDSSRNKALSLGAFNALLNDGISKIKRVKTLKTNSIEPIIKRYVDKQRILIKRTYRVLVSDAACNKAIQYGVEQMQNYYLYKRKQIIDARQEALFDKLDLELENYTSIVFAAVYRLLLISILKKNEVFAWGRSHSIHKRSDHKLLYGEMWLPNQMPPSKNQLWPGEDYGCKCTLLIKTVDAATIRKLRRQ